VIKDLMKAACNAVAIESKDVKRWVDDNPFAYPRRAGQIH
jgi:hypothetical protein